MSIQEQSEKIAIINNILEMQKVIGVSTYTFTQLMRRKADSLRSMQNDLIPEYNKVVRAKTIAQKADPRIY